MISRYQNTEKARERFGPLVDSYEKFFWMGDPKCDAAFKELQILGAQESKKILEQALEHGIENTPEAPNSLVKLFEEIDAVPMWVDWDFLTLGGMTLMRTGFFAPLVLLCRSLPFSYYMPAGNKPLALTGELVKGAELRVQETGEFIYATCIKDGLKRNAEGFKSNIRVRMRHSRVRSVLAKSEKWNRQEWGDPINQADMAAASLLFSFVLLEGLEKLGFRFSKEEKQAVLHLWRYSNHLMGMNGDLGCTRWEEASRLWDMIMMTQGEPDSDSISLTKALLEMPIHAAQTEIEKTVGKRASKFVYGLSRYLLGENYSEALKLPKEDWMFVLKIISPLVSQIEILRKTVPRGNAAAVKVGSEICRRIVFSGIAKFSLRAFGA
jgi:hypothetical protein